MIKLALGPNRSLMRQNNMLGDGEPQPGAPGFPRPSFIDTVETLEKTVQMLGGNAGSEVSDVEFDAARSRTRSEDDFFS